jgi:hypothetical protein
MGESLSILAIETGVPSSLLKKPFPQQATLASTSWLRSETQMKEILVEG